MTAGALTGIIAWMAAKKRRRPPSRHAQPYQTAAQAARWRARQNPPPGVDPYDPDVPHIRPGADGRWRVWDPRRGAYVAVFEADDIESATAMVGSLRPHARPRTIATVQAPAELDLSALDAPRRRRQKVPVTGQDPSKPYIHVSTAGFYVWHPLTQSFTGPFASREGAQDKLRDVMTQMFEVTAGRKAEKKQAHRAPVPASGLFGGLAREAQGGGRLSAAPQLGLFGTRKNPAERYRAYLEGADRRLPYAVVDLQSGLVISRHTTAEGAQALASEENAIIERKRRGRRAA